MVGRLLSPHHRPEAAGPWSAPRVLLVVVAAAAATPRLTAARWAWRRGKNAVLDADAEAARTGAAAVASRASGVDAAAAATANTAAMAATAAAAAADTLRLGGTN